MVQIVCAQFSLFVQCIRYILSTTPFEQWVCQKSDLTFKCVCVRRAHHVHVLHLRRIFIFSRVSSLQRQASLSSPRSCFWAGRWRAAACWRFRVPSATQVPVIPYCICTNSQFVAIGLLCCRLDRSRAHRTRLLSGRLQRSSLGEVLDHVARAIPRMSGTSEDTIPSQRRESIRPYS